MESPALPPLAALILRRYRLPLDGVHGPAHWLRVRANGLALAARTEGADALVVELFALFHDAEREDEGRDPGHGERAAALVRRFVAERRLHLAPSRQDLLAAACARHEHGEVSADPTIGCCWDADRLDLSRLHRRPKAHLLSTPAALDPGLQAEAWASGRLWRHDAEGARAWGLPALGA
jgi:uncharacterized protein